MELDVKVWGGSGITAPVILNVGTR
jgi:hypothetical protein